MVGKIFGLLGKLFDLVVYYRTDSAKGMPYWQDPTLIGAAISLASMALVYITGINIDLALQLKISGAIVGIGAAVSPHTGVVKHPAQVAAEAAKAVQEHNLSSMS